MRASGIETYGDTWELMPLCQALFGHCAVQCGGAGDRGLQRLLRS